MDNNQPKVIIAAPAHGSLTTGLIAKGYQCLHYPEISQETAPALISDCVGIITSTRLLLNESLLSAAPMLKWIGRMGSGMEIIDLKYAKENNIYCFSSPEGNCNAVGEHALGMLLSLIRNLRQCHNEIVHNIWLREENRGYELEGKTLGIVGFGHTGRAFAKKLMGFDMEILAYDKYSLDDIPEYVNPTNDITELCDKADIISFHVPLSADTTHYFNDRFLARMRKPFILINTSRGGVVSLESVATGIKDGKITGVCLDVFENEPLSKLQGNLLQAFQVIRSSPVAVLTPHIAGYTHEALPKMSDALLLKVPLAAELRRSLKKN